ncbi:MAG: hypothetical protein FJ271_01690 [Planctomycetes bacterium]|nr:hypothetical protein [Planctomycetota bacterium]
MDNLKPGDRVWAPWEGQFLYSATVVAVVGSSVNLRYDTGEEKAELASNLRPLQPQTQLAPGQQIFMMYDKEARSFAFYPATVQRIEGEFFDVVRDNGDVELRVSVTRVRIPEAALPLRLPPEWTLLSFVRVKEPDSRPTQRRELDSLYQVNDRVLARWQDCFWYPATVLSVSKDGIHVRYHGDMGMVNDKQLMPLFCEEGERIFMRPPEEPRLAYSPAVVTRVAGELLDVEFEETETQQRRHVANLSINRARFWRVPKGTKPPSFSAGEPVLVLLGPYWYPGRILPERLDAALAPGEDVVFVELQYVAQDVMVTPELIKPLRFHVGEEVECARGGSTYVPGTIVEIRGDKLLIRYP